MALSSLLQDTSTSSRILIAFAILSLYPAASAIYNLYFHPLSKIKGPTFWCVSRLGFISSLVRGNLVTDVRKLHEKYGDVVRLAPDEVSFAKQQAWHDVFAARDGHKHFPKNPIFFKAPPGQPENMVTTISLADNARMRKVLAPGFTESSLASQEHIIQSYLNHFITKLKQAVEARPDNGAVLNMVEWYNFYTFDVISDLCFGESFQCLETESFHPWVALIFDFLKGMTLAASTRYYPLLEALMLKAIPAKIRKLQAYHYNTALEKTHRRMNLEKEREDFMTGVFKNNPNFEKMSLEEVESTFSILIIAGSETTGTTLCGITNELVQNPEELRKLVKEVRSAFISESEMTFEALRNLPFLNAVIHEGLRLCNPIPAGLPRIVPQGGGTVCGYFLPENTHVTVNPSALAFNDKNFARSTSFLPDRYLPDSLRPIEFAADQRSNQQPFGLGPRNCIGKAMAWAEMRVVLAKMVWTFDLEPAPGHRLDWSKQKTYIVVQKEPVNILLKSAKR